MACCIIVALIVHRSITTLDYFNSLQLAGAPHSSKSEEKYGNEHILVDDEEIMTQTLSLSGLSCESCCTAIEDALRQLPGIVKVTTSFLMSSATIIYKRRVLGMPRIISTVRDAGYGASLQKHDAELVEILSRKKELGQLRTAFRGAAVLSIIAWGWSCMTALSRTTPYPHLESSLYFIFSLLPAWTVQLWYGRGIHLGAWWYGNKTGMDTLISTSIMLGLEVSLVDSILGSGSLIDRPQRANNMIHTSSALLVTVVLGGRYLNQALKAKATSRISTLHALQCATSHAVLLPDHKSQPVFLLQTNDRILIPANSVIPCDCYVVVGTTSVDQSLLTGEAAHQAKSPGDLIMSGTTNLSAPIEAVVTHPLEKSSLARLTEAVRASSASSSDCSTESLSSVETLTTYFARIVMSLALLAFFATGLAALREGRDWLIAWHEASRRAMLILSVACPCSLGLATPAATMAGINAALRHGVLLRGGLNTMRKLGSLTHMAFDKTGTLTRAGLGVSDAVFIPGTNEQDLNAMLCAVEEGQHTRHIVARAVFRWAYERRDRFKMKQLGAPITKELIVVEGKGVVGQVSLANGGAWTKVTVGSSRFLEEEGISIQETQHLTCLTSNHRVYIGINGEYAGFLSLEDVVRPEAPETLKKLRSMGLQTCLITGDNTEEAQRVADIVGIERDQITSSALPWVKESTIQEIQHKGGAVAMIGDGINDLAAQSTADVSVAVCAGGDSSGLGVAVAFSSSADVTLLSGADLRGLCETVRIARRTVWQARVNLIWALAYNTIGLLVAVGALEPFGICLEVSATGTIMAMSSVSVLLLSQTIS